MLVGALGPKRSGDVSNSVFQTTLMSVMKCLVARETPPSKQPTSKKAISTLGSVQVSEKSDTFAGLSETWPRPFKIQELICVSFVHNGNYPLCSRNTTNHNDRGREGVGEVHAEAAVGTRVGDRGNAAADDVVIVARGVDGERDR